jgi:hypothetical protein
MALFLFALDKLNATTSLASNRSVCDLSGVFCIFLFSIANCRRARLHSDRRGTNKGTGTLSTAKLAGRQCAARHARNPLIPGLLGKIPAISSIAVSFAPIRSLLRRPDKACRKKSTIGDI